MPSSGKKTSNHYPPPIINLHFPEFDKELNWEPSTNHRPSKRPPTPPRQWYGATFSNPACVHALHKCLAFGWCAVHRAGPYRTGLTRHTMPRVCRGGAHVIGASGQRTGQPPQATGLPRRGSLGALQGDPPRGPTRRVLRGGAAAAWLHGFLRETNRQEMRADTD